MAETKKFLTKEQAEKLYPEAFPPLTPEEAQEEKDWYGDRDFHEVYYVKDGKLHMECEEELIHNFYHDGEWHDANPIS